MNTVVVLVFNECGLTPAIGLAELLCKAWSVRQGLGLVDGELAPKVRLVAASSDRTLRADGDLRVVCQACLDEVDDADLVVVPAFDGEILDQMEKNRTAIPWIRRRFDEGATIASICTGTFALAEAGLLDGRSATTHWAAQELFKQLYPSVTLLSQEIVVDEGRIITSGGAYSFLNLGIHLVARLFGEETAVVASRICLIDLVKSPQGSYAVFSPPVTSEDANIRRAQAMIDEGLASNLTVEGLADGVALSRRQFLRRFKAATGLTPQKYLQLARIEAAKGTLIRSRDPIDEVASSVGYSDTPGFRKVFVRVTGLTPSEYRRRNRVLGNVSGTGLAGESNQQSTASI